ncbi:MAG TPA: di-heme oxidoredictase family protein [Terriglobia bacterium]|nr:di-heme oxidoredictase family protein [Terriglobia bacterium]
MKPKTLFSLGGIVVLSASLSLFFESRQQMQAGTTGLGQNNCPLGQNCQPPPPPPPGVGQLGGPLAGLTTGQTSLFTTGYDTFNVKWDPIRGLGPVFTQAGCYNCHGGGNNVITQCKFNPPGVACVDGGSSNILGTRYGKWNSDGTFNYLDGTGTFPENEGGPVLHGQSVAQFVTIAGCSNMTIAASPTGITQSGTTVTVTTTANHGFLAGQISTVAGVPVNGYNGNFTILSVPSATSFTYTDSTSGLAGSGGGTANNLPHEVVPADATVVGTLRSPELYGLGLVDSIPDSTIQANATAECANKGSTGICGVANMVPDQNGNIHVGRFGQKSTFPTLLSFTAAAFNNETGITNAYFPVQHLPSGLPYPPKCAPDTHNPEDSTGSFMLQAHQFNELLAPVVPGPPNSAGKTVFENTGCNICHTESMTTGANIKLQTNLNGGVSTVIAPLSNATANLYSDLLLHDMGPGLSGGIPFQPDQQGQASLTQWRTAPLWGLSTRCGTVGSNGACSLLLGLLHDNRTTNLNTAILDHGGEAASVITAYQKLNSTDNANLLAFLSSL